MLSAPVKLDDLVAAFEWVSASSPGDNQGFVSRITGNVYWSSSVVDLGEELPCDIGDENIYATVPHKYDLNLGKNLALTFADEWLADSYKVVSAIFCQNGAYRKFKDLLERRGLLDAWSDYETKAIELALRQWAAEQGLLIAEEAGQNAANAAHQAENRA